MSKISSSHVNCNDDSHRSSSKESPSTNTIPSLTSSTSSSSQSAHRHPWRTQSNHTNSTGGGEGSSNTTTSLADTTTTSTTCLRVIMQEQQDEARRRKEQQQQQQQEEERMNRSYCHNHDDGADEELQRALHLSLLELNMDPPTLHCEGNIATTPLKSSSSSLSPGNTGSITQNNMNEIEGTILSSLVGSASNESHHSVRSVAIHRQLSTEHDDTHSIGPETTSPHSPYMKSPSYSARKMLLGYQIRSQLALHGLGLPSESSGNGPEHPVGRNAPAAPVPLSDYPISLIGRDAGSSPWSNRQTRAPDQNMTDNGHRTRSCVQNLDQHEPVAHSSVAMEPMSGTILTSRAPTLPTTNSPCESVSRMKNYSPPSSMDPHITPEELEQIVLALQQSGESDLLLYQQMPPSSIPRSGTDQSYLDSNQRDDASDTIIPSNDVEETPPATNVQLSDEEAAQIERAIREADEAEEQKSIALALHIMELEAANQTSVHPARQPQGNVRILSREQLEEEMRMGMMQQFNSPARFSQYSSLQEEDIGGATAAGFRMNTSGRQQWQRLDQNSVVGPNNEIRTKHDTRLQGQANAHRLALDVNDDGESINVGNKAYNSFMHSVRRKQTKGVAAHGTGRAGSDADGVKGGAMDPAVRIQISKAVNNGLIEKCNGVVKEGKEAIIYHANAGPESGGFDVAIKVFKRIQEFKARGDYVEGDPRYARVSFRNISAQEQLNLWTEKEFRNLSRANQGGVPVPTPLYSKDNVLYMRFIGADGWPAPQLRELNLRRGSDRWTTLYSQVIDAMMKLYRNARLVHGDLSEYNILVGPTTLVENKATRTMVEGAFDLQIILIDFGQAVDVRHPDAHTLLLRDIERVHLFFQRKDVEIVTNENLLALVTNQAEDAAAEACR